MHRGLDDWHVLTIHGGVAAYWLPLGLESLRTARDEGSLQYHRYSLIQPFHWLSAKAKDSGVGKASAAR